MKSLSTKARLHHARRSQVIRCADGVSVGGRNGKTSGEAAVAWVQDAMRARNYSPDHVDRSLRGKRTMAIGMVIPDVLAAACFVLRDAPSGRCCANGEYSVLLCNPDDDAEQERRHVRTLLARKVDGILLASTDLYSVGQESFGIGYAASRVR